MEKGYLSQYFQGVAAKKLSTVEANPAASNQHEFNGVRILKEIFGTPEGKMHISTRFLYLNDDDEPVSAEGILTWYDARENHLTRTEWRLYYPSNNVSNSMSAGDSLFICLKRDGSALVVVAQAESSIESQLSWMFDISEPGADSFEIRQQSELDRNQMFLASRLILNEIGIEIKDYAQEYLEDMIRRFGITFPKTKDFSAYARSTVTNISPDEDPDTALLEWLDREELLFRTMEKHLITKRLHQGFTTDNEADVDSFIAFSLSVQNRRKSRVGQALENHIEEIFIANQICYSRTPVTENKSKPDFIFPGINAYKNVDFPPSGLTMLGAKSTCKDRWRQVLDEADRIKHKHLLTLEAAISETQTSAMIDRDIQLVIPSRLHGSYNARQQKWLFSVDDFLKEVKRKQNHISQSSYYIK